MPSNRAVEFSQSVQVTEFVLPYTTATYVDNMNVTHTVQTGDLQRLYIDVHTTDYNDQRLIYSIDDHIRGARFALTRNKVQNNTLGVPTWIKFKTNMDQVTRFTRNQPIVINIMQEQGYTLIINDPGPLPDSLLQNWLLLEVMPYFRDANFTNQGLGLTQLT
jgi:hypothetical protein